MIGARDMAFPRLNALSFWLFVAGGVVFYALDLLLARPSAAGRATRRCRETAVLAHRRRRRVDLPRPPHRHLARCSARSTSTRRSPTCARPAWAGAACRCSSGRSSIYAILLILALPVIAGAVTLLLTDRHFGTHFFDADQRRLAAALAAPVLVLRAPRGLHHGAARRSGSSPRSCRSSPASRSSATRRSRRRPSVIAFLGLLVWAHHMFATPSPTFVLIFFMLGSFLIAVPTGVKIFNWIATLWRGHDRVQDAAAVRVGFLGDVPASAASPASSWPSSRSTGSSPTRTSSSPTSTTC